MSVTIPNAAEPAGPPLAAPPSGGGTQPPDYPQLLGHPKPLWMLFMTEFWERFAFYGIRWALVLYIVAQFHGGSAAAAKLQRQSDLRRVSGAGLRGGDLRWLRGGQNYRLSALDPGRRGDHGRGPVHDRAAERTDYSNWGLATIIAGNGLFKPNISTMVGKLVRAPPDEAPRFGFHHLLHGHQPGRDDLALILTRLAGRARCSAAIRHLPAYKVVFITSGIGMLISAWCGSGSAADSSQGVGRPPVGRRRRRAVCC